MPPVTFLGVIFRPGDIVHAADDGLALPESAVS
jgi:hypothetical protein